MVVVWLPWVYLLLVLGRNPGVFRLADVAVVLVLGIGVLNKVVVAPYVVSYPVMLVSYGYLWRKKIVCREFVEAGRLVVMVICLHHFYQQHMQERVARASALNCGIAAGLLLP